jgi:hypothetical protein
MNRLFGVLFVILCIPVFVVIVIAAILECAASLLFVREYHGNDILEKTLCPK